MRILWYTKTDEKNCPVFSEKKMIIFRKFLIIFRMDFLLPEVTPYASTK